jgi:hypothetical protein
MTASAGAPAALANPVPLVISELLPNPQGTDSPFEYVELVATTAIDFAQTPYSVVWANNGTGTAAGWTAGGAITYGFTINSGSVSRGDVVYVGGTSLAPGGNTSVTKLRTINTTSVNGDGFGTAGSDVMGNGGSNADGIAVFDVAASAVTSSTVPVDALFYGSAAGKAVVSGGAAGYELPVNDLYAGGKMQASSFVGPDAGGAEVIVAAGVYDADVGAFTTARTFSVVAGPAGASVGGDNNGTANASAVLVTAPEPGVAGVMLVAAVGGLLIRRRRR